MVEMNNTKVKKIYVKPVIESEEFVANEYVAACGTYTKWIVTCDWTTQDGNPACTWDLDKSTNKPTISSDSRYYDNKNDYLSSINVSSTSSGYEHHHSGNSAQHRYNASITEVEVNASF